MDKLSISEIQEKLNNSNGWEVSEDRIKKEFILPDFRAAVGFVNKIADLAEKDNHHPVIKLDYNKVKVKLSTHSADGVTEKDTTLASKIEQLN